MKTILNYLLLMAGITKVCQGPFISNELNKWNSETLEAIARHEQLCSDSATKKIWQKELKFMRRILFAPTYKDDERKIKDDPLRQKFLKQIMLTKEISKYFFVVESQASDGEVVEIRNYLILIKNGKYNIERYNERGGNWVKAKDTIMSNICFSNDIMVRNVKNVRYRSTGDNIIISEFRNGEIKCNYFLPYTIKPNSSIIKILEIDR